MDKTIENRFYRNVEKTDTCWIWHGTVTNHGYGQLSMGLRGKCTFISSHRLSWILANKKDIPSGMEILHSCDNKLCVNPNHLSVGTHQKNMQEAKERNRIAKGLRNGAAVYDDIMVEEIKNMFGSVPAMSIAKLCGVSRSYVYKVGKGLCRA
jgi:hypothetical protein